MDRYIYKSDFWFHREEDKEPRQEILSSLFISVIDS